MLVTVEVNSVMNRDAECKQRIDDMDLSPVVDRMIQVYRWKKKYAFIVMEQYKNFLFLKWKYGNNYLLPPSVEIDEFWHNHILHTQNYYQDCLKLFGEYLHHHPQHKDAQSITKRELEWRFENETQRFYQLEFGDYIYAYF